MAHHEFDATDTGEIERWLGVTEGDGRALRRALEPDHVPDVTAPQPPHPGQSPP